MLVAPLGMTMLSDQTIDPSVGATQTSSALPDEARSPLHVIAAHVAFEAKSVRYSLPTKRSLPPEYDAMSSWTAWRSSSVVVAGSALLPSLRRPRPNVSRFSLRNVTLSGGRAHR